jgi:hypothetical protein
MKNEKKTKEKAAEKPEKEAVDVELDDKALDAVSGGCINLPNIPDLSKLTRDPKLDGGTQ